jgi:hypothetical protein
VGFRSLLEQFGELSKLLVAQPPPPPWMGLARQILPGTSHTPPDVD